MYNTLEDKTNAIEREEVYETAHYLDAACSSINKTAIGQQLPDKLESYAT